MHYCTFKRNKGKKLEGKMHYCTFKGDKRKRKASFCE